MDTNTLSYRDRIPEQRLGAEESHLPRPELEVAILVVHYTIIP
jgi:hypothetical protein